MDRGWWGRFVLLVAVVVFGIGMVIPTLFQLDPEKSSFPIQKKINLGLDLQGGVYLVLGVDFNKVYKGVVARQVQSLQSRLNEKKIDLKSEWIQEAGVSDDPKMKLEVPGSLDIPLKTLKDEYPSLRLVQQGEKDFSVGLALNERKNIREKTIAQSIEVVRNRIDEFGVAEPSIAAQGEDRIIVELPGIKDIERAKELVGRTAKLEFRLVHEYDPQQLIKWVQEAQESGIQYQKGQKFSEYRDNLNQFLKDKLPAKTEISFERSESLPENENNSEKMPILVSADAPVTGQELADAQVANSPEDHRPLVSFEFNPRGAAVFSQLTGESIGKRLAIVLDGIVFSAPVIQSQIGSRGQITLGSGSIDQAMKEAKDLAIVLRAGALPAELEVLEERVVGPSLGKDSISKGTYSALIGALLVFALISFYYRKSGVIAVVSLLINVLLVVALLITLDATLTMPGIAGIALTVGIAVDSNVVIYERIREELRAGKTVRTSVEMGFQKAFRTILDANVTNAAASIVLLTYGTGPIKGFAVTMLIGIVTTLFTAVFFCKLVFDAILNRGKEAPESLSI